MGHVPDVPQVTQAEFAIELVDIDSARRQADEQPNMSPLGMMVGGGGGGGNRSGGGGGGVRGGGEGRGGDGGGEKDVKLVTPQPIMVLSPS